MLWVNISPPMSNCLSGGCSPEKHFKFLTKTICLINCECRHILPCDETLWHTDPECFTFSRPGPGIRCHGQSLLILGLSLVETDHVILYWPLIGPLSVSYWSKLSEFSSWWVMITLCTLTGLDTPVNNNYGNRIRDWRDNIMARKICLWNSLKQQKHNFPKNSWFSWVCCLVILDYVVFYNVTSLEPVTPTLHDEPTSSK